MHGTVMPHPLAQGARATGAARRTDLRAAAPRGHSGRRRLSTPLSLLRRCSLPHHPSVWPSHQLSQPGRTAGAEPACRNPTSSQTALQPPVCHPLRSRHVGAVTGARAALAGLPLRSHSFSRRAASSPGPPPPPACRGSLPDSAGTRPRPGGGSSTPAAAPHRRRLAAAVPPSLARPPHRRASRTASSRPLGCPRSKREQEPLEAAPSRSTSRRAPAGAARSRSPWRRARCAAKTAGRVCALSRLGCP